jgi:hypothetical protein
MFCDKVGKKRHQVFGALIMLFIVVAIVAVGVKMTYRSATKANNLISTAQPELQDLAHSRDEQNKTVFEKKTEEKFEKQKSGTASSQLCRTMPDQSALDSSDPDASNDGTNIPRRTNSQEERDDTSKRWSRKKIFFLLFGVAISYTSLSFQTCLIFLAGVFLGSAAPQSASFLMKSPNKMIEILQRAKAQGNPMLFRGIPSKSPPLATCKNPLNTIGEAVEEYSTSTKSVCHGCTFDLAGGASGTSIYISRLQKFIPLIIFIGIATISYLVKWGWWRYNAKRDNRKI